MALSEAEAQAAASVTAALMADFTGPGAQAAEVEAPETPVSSAPPTTDTADIPVDDTDEAPAQSFEYSPEVPEDILRELDEADIDEQVEREVTARETEDDTYSEYGQAESEDEIRERLRLQKRNEYLEAELAKTRRGGWESEAKKYFPLSEHALTDITATSRRAFLKQAKAHHEAILPHVQKVLQEAKGFIDQSRTDAVADGKNAAKAAFGTPLSGPDVQTVDQAAQDAEITKARENAKQTGSLVGLFKTMMNQGK